MKYKHKYEAKYSDIKVGKKVMNENGDIGVIVNCDDPHNIVVKYVNGGKGLFCLEPNCSIDEKLYIIEK